MSSPHELIAKVQNILTSPDAKLEVKAKARQLLFLSVPLSTVIETYLYDNEGRPQNLEKFQMMRPIYDKTPQRLLLKCSRKTLKSTLLSNMIALNLLRYEHYKMLYTAPQELSTKYFSNNYLNVRFESPPLKRVIQGFSRNDVFEKTLGDTNSSVILRYCKEDASRIRGPATDHNIFDESIVSSSLIRTYEGEKKIVDIRVGDIVHCANEQYQITTDRVVRWKSEGKRHVWRITLQSGEYLECTSRSKLSTNYGWTYLAQLLPEQELNRCDKAKQLLSLLPPAKAVGPGDAAWGRLHGLCCQVSQVPSKPGDKAEGVCSAQIRSDEELCADSSSNTAQRWVRRGELLFFDGQYSSVRVCTQPLLSRGGREVGQNCNEGMAGTDRLGGDSLLVHGRRITGEVESVVVPHGRISEGASSPDWGMACLERSQPYCGGNTRVLDCPTETAGSIQADRQDSAVHCSIDEVQGGRKTASLRKLWDSSISWVNKVLQGGSVSVAPSAYCEGSLRAEAQGHGKVQRDKRWDQPASQRKEETEISGGSYLPGEDQTPGFQTTGQKECCTPSEESGAQIVSIEYAGEQDVYDIETEKYHNFFANGILVHNCQDVSFEVLPIIKETMALSPYKREIFAGTPLTTDNTIHELWKTSSQCEWVTKCTGCNHWNSLTPDNEPMKMIQAQGLSCSKCGHLLDTGTGEWIEFNPGNYDLIGYHLAQPILTHFNQDKKEWGEIHKKAWNTGPNKYSMAQIYNELFGLAFDTGSKPITEEQLKKLSVLGDMATVYDRQHNRYLYITCGVDWGVNMETSRTAVVMGGMREDGVYEVFFARILKDFDYERHVVEIAGLINSYGAYCACDSGPDVARGKKLADMTSWQKTQLVRYEDGLLIQQYKSPSNAVHPSQNRWCLHRSDTMTLVFDLLKKDKVLFPMWEQMHECFSDIMNVFIEVKEGMLRQELVYRHSPSKPDDFFHALNFAVCQANMLAGNPLLNAPSSSAVTPEWQGGVSG